MRTIALPMPQKGSRGQQFNIVLSAKHLPVGARGKFRTSAAAAKKLLIMKLQEVRKPSPDFARTAVLLALIHTQPKEGCVLRVDRGRRLDPTGGDSRGGLSSSFKQTLKLCAGTPCLDLTLLVCRICSEDQCHKNKSGNRQPHALQLTGKLKVQAVLLHRYTKNQYRRSPAS
eukprot:s2395_g2.t1